MSRAKLVAKITSSRFHEDLICKLTDAERIERGNAMAKHARDIETIEAEAKSAADSFKGRANTLRAELRKLSIAIDTGEESRRIECEETRRFDLGVVRVVRLDSLEQVRERPMEPHERQVELAIDKHTDGGDVLDRPGQQAIADVACPYCDVQTREHCIADNGDDLGDAKFHKSRVDAWLSRPRSSDRKPKKTPTKKGPKR